MNVKEYISSGIIESYVLGIATEAERQEFELLCNSYPEIIEARKAFELSLEEELLKDTKQPPQHLKQLIEEKLVSATNGTNVEEYEEERPVRRMDAWKWLAAASFILLAGAIYWAITANNKYQQQLAENKRLQNELQESTVQLNQMQQDVDIIKHPMKTASLRGTKIAPEAMVTVYWDTAATKDVYLMINNLPQPPTDKQYQLWALLNGQPIDLGVFDMDIRQKRLWVKMQNVQNAQAFAITLEPKGGNRQPTMDSMYVIGSL